MAKEKTATAPKKEAQGERFYLRREGPRFWIERSATYPEASKGASGRAIETVASYETVEDAKGRFEKLQRHYRGSNLTLEVK